MSHRGSGGEPRGPEFRSPGINHRPALGGGNNIGIGFAVPVDRARQVARNLISRG